MMAAGNLPFRLARARVMSWPGLEDKGWLAVGPGVCDCTERPSLVAWGVVLGYAT